LHQLLLTDGVNLNTIPAEATDEKISIYVQSNN
jgi:hypothetical protein